MPSSAKKLVNWTPTDIKADMLAKYPPKVARIRGSCF